MLTAIYTSSDDVDSWQYISVRVPFNEGNFKVKLTGIPLHVANLTSIISGLKVEMTNITPTLLQVIHTILDDQTFGDVLFQTRIEALLEKLFGSKIEGIHDEMRKLQSNKQSDGDGGKGKIESKKRSDSELFSTCMIEFSAKLGLAGTCLSLPLHLHIVFGILGSKSRR